MARKRIANMGRGHSKFRKRDVQSAVAGARAAGVEIASIMLKPDGTVLLATGKPGPNNESGANSWDEVLGNEDEVAVHPKVRR
jgi:hypothetical protein